MPEVEVTLSTVCQGELEKKFQEILPGLICALGQGQKGKITIGLEFARVPDTTTMVAASFSISPTFPAIKKASICQITENYGLKTEAPMEKPKLVNMFKEDSN